MSGELARAWGSLALGIAAVVLINSAVGLFPPFLLGLAGSALGYALWRLLPAPPRRGPPKYWRGRAHWD